MKRNGYSLLEVLVVIAVSAIVASAAVPLTHASIDRSRAVGAAGYVAGRMAVARFEAVRRSACVAIRFAHQPDGYWLQSYVDGNRNGVLAQDIVDGIDSPITAAERLEYHFSGIEFGIQPNVIGIDPGPFNASDPVQIGNSSLLSFSPTGTSTSGTVFIRGLKGSQFAVRLLGATGRTRILEFNFGERRWTTR